VYELKKLEGYLRANLLGPGPRLIKKKRIYRAAVSQRLRNTGLRRRTPDLQLTTTLDNTPYCCNHSLTLLKMSKRLPETC